MTLAGYRLADLLTTVANHVTSQRGFVPFAQQKRAHMDAMRQELRVFDAAMAAATAVPVAVDPDPNWATTRFWSLIAAGGVMAAGVVAAIAVGVVRSLRASSVDDESLRPLLV